MSWETASRLSRKFSSRLVVACSNVTGAIVLCVLLVGYGPLSMRQARAQEKPAPQEKDAPQKLEKIKNSIGMELVRIPAGKFLMGSPEDEEGHEEGEFQREKTIKTPFYLGVYEVTQEQYEEVMNKNPWEDKGPNLPAGSISWWDAMRFCRKLSEMESETYRLPTEMEWEYACRAGTKTTFNFGDKAVYKDANFHPAYPYPYLEESVSKEDFGLPGVVLQPVGAYKPNAFGLYDMHGNVSEWCLDRLDHRSDLFILRGGNGRIAAMYCRSAFRYAHNGGWKWTGFRVVRTVEPELGEIEIPITHAIDQADRYETDEMLVKIKEAFSKPATSLLPPVVIFPAVDAERHVRIDGVGLSLVTNYAVAYTPQRRMAISLPEVRSRLLNAGLFKPGTEIDDESIKICLAAIGAKHYVLPQVVEENDKLKLTFAVRTLDDSDVEAATPLIFEKDQLNQIPGTIARGVLEQIGAELSEAEIAHISKPKVLRSKDFQQLSHIAWTMTFGKDNRDLLLVVLRNPLCLPAWELYVFNSNPAEKAFDRFKKVKIRLLCDRLQICTGVRKTASDDEILALLEMAPQFQGDSYYYAALAILAKNMSEPELVRQILEEWRNEDPGYSGCLQRGLLFYAWANSDRETGDIVPPEERLELAQQELEQGIEINPQDWEARTQMIKVAMDLDMPFEIVDEHFQAAIKARPRSRQAYSTMFDVLQSRWNNNLEENNHEDLLIFAGQCVRTGYFEEGIPDLSMDFIRDTIEIPGDRAIVRTSSRDPELWAIVSDYNQGIQAIKNSPGVDYSAKKRYARNLYAKYGAYGSHFDKVADTFRQLEKEGPDPLVFWDGFTYAFLRDLVFSQEESGQAQNIAAMRAALDVGNFDAAARWLDKVKADNDGDKKLIKRNRLAIKLGRQLREEGFLDLSAETMFQLFDGIDDAWKVDDDALVCHLPAQKSSLILLPFGIENAEVTGTIRWMDLPKKVHVHSHTRALRDNVALQYNLQNIQYKWVGLHRGNNRKRFRNGDNFQGDEVNFRMTLGTEEDTFSPATEIEWSALVIENVPSGFGFQVDAADGNASTVRFTDVRIELID
ncbi:Formylglycine-generating sulfatase enzyme [Symmachiella macrocystis]|uniref:Formylglycine-generating sulfatase enzyme n=2 Tax=Symmachiella macrocystis TaxID=2527985 RepID=A0A5C6BAF8_9PLAN|nr:Formylglycine-generating sulfatase enzyme [Symmachiella macrocystis]